MPHGDKSSYSSKQKRQAEHIEEGYEKRGASKKEAERRAWATVNKESGGGKKKKSSKKKAGSRSKRATQKGGREETFGRSKEGGAEEVELTAAGYHPHGGVAREAAGRRGALRGERGG